MNYNKLKNTTVLVTGGAGFIGSSMCKKLLSLGSKVVCVDNLSTGDISNIAEILKNDKFVFINCDVNRLNRLEHVFKKYKFDYVLHYAAMVGVENTLNNPLGVLNDIEGIKNILSLSKNYSVKKVIFSSSSEVYGDPVEFPQKEESTPLNTKLPYALVKAVGEAYCKSYYEKYKLPVTNLRFFNVYGPCQNSSSYGFVTAIFIKQVLLGDEVTVFGDGSQTRDFVFIEDNLNATLSALLSQKCNGLSINIGTNKETTILSLAKKIIKISGNNSKIKFCSPRKKGDMRGRRPDISRMTKILKYTPKYNLDSGLKITYEWYSKNIVSYR